MNDSKYFEEYFHDRFYNLNEEGILRLNTIQKDGRINNVIVGIHAHCYGLYLVDDTEIINYHIYYINGVNALTGHLLKLKLDDPERDKLLYTFSNYIADTYKLDDVITVFNTFQDLTRTVCEQFEYRVISPNDFAEYEGRSISILVKDVKGVVFLPFLDHLQLYKFIFGECKFTSQNLGDSFVYLMFNKRNKFIKIGKSINPIHREKTLQAEEPDITMIAVWKASDKVERELHKKFSLKRKRGEWFDLSFSELKSIKNHMDEIESLKQA